MCALALYRVITRYYANFIQEDNHEEESFLPQTTFDDPDRLNAFRMRSSEIPKRPKV